MSVEYGNILYDGPDQARKAAIEDWLYAGGNNSREDVALMDPDAEADELIDEFRRGNWHIPFSVNNTITVRDCVARIIIDAKYDDEGAENHDT